MTARAVTVGYPPTTVYELDNDWAVTVRAPRWRVRAATEVEWEHANATSDDPTVCHGCATCCRFFLVMLSPSRRHRIRIGFSDYSRQRPDDLMPGWFVRLMIAPDDVTWLDRLEEFLGHPIEGRR